MPEISPYFDAVIAARSMLLDEWSALEGTTTVSLETQTELGEADIFSYIEENFVQFLQTLRYLSKEDQELLLSYYILAKTQTTLAILHRSTQTLCSARIRMAMQKMGTFILLGPPTAELTSKVFTELGLEQSLKSPDTEAVVPLSQVVDLYAKTRSFQRVAEVLQLHRPDVRRVMSQTSKQLLESQDIRHRALGAYLFDLTEKASASGKGFSKRKLAKQGSIYCRDSDLLGDFTVNVAHADFDQLFISRANR